MRIDNHVVKTLHKHFGEETMQAWLELPLLYIKGEQWDAIRQASLKKGLLEDAGEKFAAYNGERAGDIGSPRFRYEGFDDIIWPWDAFNFLIETALVVDNDYIGQIAGTFQLEGNYGRISVQMEVFHSETKKVYPAIYAAQFSVHAEHEAMIGIHGVKVSKLVPEYLAHSWCYSLSRDRTTHWYARTSLRILFLCIKYFYDFGLYRVKVNAKPQTESRRKGKGKPSKKPWIKPVSHIVYLHPAQVGEYTKSTATGEGVPLKKGHIRRAHRRTLSDPRYRNHPKYMKYKAIRVRQSWAGPKEWDHEGNTYIVDLGDEFMRQINLEEEVSREGFSIEV